MCTHILELLGIEISTSIAHTYFKSSWAFEILTSCYCTHTCDKFQYVYTHSWAIGHWNFNIYCTHILKSCWALKFQHLMHMHAHNWNSYWGIEISMPSTLSESSMGLKFQPLQQNLIHASNDYMHWNFNIGIFRHWNFNIGILSNA